MSVQSKDHPASIRWIIGVLLSLAAVFVALKAHAEWQNVPPPVQPAAPQILATGTLAKEDAERLERLNQNRTRLSQLESDNP